MASLLKMPPARPVSAAEAPRSALPRGACIITHSYPALGERPNRYQARHCISPAAALLLCTLPRGSLCSGSAITERNLRSGQGANHRVLWCLATKLLCVEELSAHAEHPRRAGGQLPAVQRCLMRPALSRSTVNFATTESADELAARVTDADLSHHSGESIGVDFCVHYVVRALCLWDHLL